jgi:tetratricopeptide (TPR) repeat protein
MASKNFAFMARYDSNFDLFGADAERLLHEQPDLACLRIRQLCELYVRMIADRYHISLKEWESNLPLIDCIRRVRDERRISEETARTLHAIRKTCNDAVHAPVDNNVYDPKLFAAAARSYLPSLWRIFVKEHKERVGEFQAVFEMPHLDSSVAADDDTFFSQLSQVLDEVELAVEAAPRDYNTIEDRLRRFGEARKSVSWKESLKDDERNLLLLRDASINLNLSNHQGRMPMTKDVPAALQERSRLLLSSADPTILDEVTLFHNRWAVAQLNAFQFDEARDQINQFVERRSAAIKANYSVLGEVVVRDYHMGALLGTLGQCYVFLAHAYESYAERDEAIRIFEKAEGHFSAQKDIDRQVTYRTQALVDKLRFDNDVEISSLSENQQRLVDFHEPTIVKAVDDFLVSPFGETDPYKISLGLKVALTIGERPDWLPQLEESVAANLKSKCSIDPDWLPRHPYENILGILLLLNPTPPKIVAEILTRISHENTLVGFLASIYLMEKQYRAKQSTDAGIVMAVLDRWHASENFPAGWHEYEFDRRFKNLCAAGGGGPLQILAFYYA